jgi:outer membrane protein TolC
MTAAALLALALTAQEPTRLTLADAVRRAAAVPAVALAELRSDGAHERVRQARAGLLPSFGASAGWLNRSFNRASLGITFPTAPGQAAPSDLIGPFDNYDVRLRGTQALFDRAAVVRLRAARAQRSGVEADEAVVAEAAAAFAAFAYLRISRAEAQFAARVADSALAAELAALADAQVAAGVAQAIDATRARTQLVAARGAVLVARAARDRAALELAHAVGLSAEDTVAPADTLGTDLARPDVPRDRDAAVAVALARRPDLAAEAARHTAAQTGVAAVAAERLPRVELTADAGLNGPADHLLGTGQVGVQVVLPLFDGLRREARVAEQLVATREADLRRRELDRQIRLDVATALLDLDAATAQLTIAAERLQLGEAEVRQARDRFAAGVTGNIEVITAQLGLLEARDGWIDARYAAAAARVALARAAGAARDLQ